VRLLGAPGRRNSCKSLPSCTAAEVSKSVTTESFGGPTSAGAAYRGVISQQAPPCRRAIIGAVVASVNEQDDDWAARFRVLVELPEDASGDERRRRVGSSSVS